MKLSRLLGTAFVLGASLIGLSALTAHPAHGTDLQDSSTLVAHPTADINDVYVFPAPNTPSDVVVMMTINSGLSSTAAGSASFDPAVLYQFKVAHTASPSSAAAPGNEDAVFQFLVNGTGTGQTLSLYGPNVPNRVGTISTVVAARTTTPIPFGKATSVSVTDDAIPAATSPVTLQVFAGVITDPAFFDLNRFYAIFPDRNAANHVTGMTLPAAATTGFSGTAVPCSAVTPPPTNYFSQKKALAIAIEMPKSYLQQVPGSAVSQPYVHVWATTSTVSGS